MPVDAFVVREHAAENDTCDDPWSVDFFDDELDEAVVQQQHRVARNVLRQLFIVESDAVLVAKLAFRIEHEALAGLERNFSFRKLTNANLRPLQIGHDADLARQRSPDLAHEPRALELILGRPMREVEAYDIDAGCNHSMQYSGIAARGTERGDDFGGAGQDSSPIRNNEKWYVNSPVAVVQPGSRIKCRAWPPSGSAFFSTLAKGILP